MRPPIGPQTAGTPLGRGRSRRLDGLLARGRSRRSDGQLAHGRSGQTTCQPAGGQAGMLGWLASPLRAILTWLALCAMIVSLAVSPAPAQAAPAPLGIRIGLAWDRWATICGGQPARGVTAPQDYVLWPAPGGSPAAGAGRTEPVAGDYMVATAGSVSAVVAADSPWLARAAAAAVERAARAGGTAAPWRGRVLVSMQGPSWYAWLDPAAVGSSAAAATARLLEAGWPAATAAWPVAPGSPVMPRQGLCAVGLSGANAGVVFGAASPVAFGPYPAAPGGAVTHIGRAYRGRLELMTIGDARLLSVINPVDIEDYLLGVVPSEMPPSWPLEALKAQAVAARTYAVSNLGRHAGRGFDLCFDIHCQAYGGIATEHPGPTAAVRQTAGIVATYNRRLINAVYHAHAGGVTDSSQAIWGAAEPYLVGTSRTYEQPYYWTATNPRRDVEAALSKALGGAVPPGTLPALKLTPRDFTPGRRATRVDVAGQTASARITAGQLRAALGSYRLRSGSFRADLVWLAAAWPDWPSEGSLSAGLPLVTWAPGARGQGVMVLRATGAAATAEAAGATAAPPAVAVWLDPAYFVFSGEGFGHGVGMSQWGAREMAALGRNYREILANFYQGIALATNYGR
jgi:stage II sporulation protein D